MRAAAAAIRVQRPEHLVAAVPVAPAETGSVLRSEVEAVICAVSPQPFFSVGYEDFSQTSDEEVRQLLQRAADSLTMFPCR